MLKFNQKKPHPALQNYIRGYWLLEGSESAETIDLVPDGYPELFFVLNGALKMQHFSGHKHWEKFAEGGLIGQGTSRFTFESAAFSAVLYVKLYPWTPFTLFQIPSSQFTDAATELSSITQDPAYRALSAQVYEAQHIDAIVSLLDAFFLQKIDGLGEENSFLQHAVRQIYSSNGTVSVEQLTNRIRASRRYVEKLFKQEIGMSPKHYAQLIRVKKASMLLLDPRYRGNINSIAGSLDYYDHSHFLKDFNGVVQQSPTQFLQQQLNLSTENITAYLDQWDYS